VGGLKGDTSCGDIPHVKSLPLNMKGPIIVQTVETTTTNLLEHSGCVETATLPKQDQTVPQKIRIFLQVPRILTGLLIEANLLPSTMKSSEWKQNLLYNPAANHSFTIFTHVLDHPTSMLHLNTITMAIRDVKYI
jgi:hypothetical protein